MTLNKIEKSSETEKPIIFMEFSTSEDSGIFRDNIEHLEALDYSAKVRVAISYLQYNSSHSQKSNAAGFFIEQRKGISFIEEPDFSFLGLSPEKITLDKLESLLKKIETDIRQRVKKSIEAGIKLNFEHFCSLHNLDQTERIILALLISNNISRSFRRLYQSCQLDSEPRNDGSMTIGSILSIIYPEYRDQISGRKYFNIDAPLTRHEIIIPYYNYTNTTNILDMPVHLHERAIRFILEDNNTYDTDLRYISRIKGVIGLDRVIMPEDLKREVIELARNYLQGRTTQQRILIERFYGYGTGLTFLFHGPSGTGKTMLAHALSNELDMELLSINFSMASRVMMSVDDLIKIIFREAKLCNGIVFFDECDDVFRKDTSESRTLLIEIEKTGCITILSSNKVIELDPALDRRITLKVPFSLPDESERLKIWKAHLPPNVSLGPDVDLGAFTRDYIFTGGLIKNALFMAVTNVLAKGKNSGLTVTSAELQRAAEYQACRMTGSNVSEEFIEPEITLEGLALKNKDKEILKSLTRCIGNADRNNTDIKLIMNCSDIRTGACCAEAVAKACNLKVRMFSLPDMLVGEIASMVVPDPLTQENIEPLEYAFRNFIGPRSLTLFVDNSSIFEQYLKNSKGNNRGKEYLDFYYCMENFKGILFMVTNPVREEDVPVEFNYYIKIHLPPEELQIRQWERHFKGHEDVEDKIVQVVERHSLHINEIDLIARQVNIEASLNGNGQSITGEHLFNVIGRYMKKKRVPILFGAWGDPHK